MEDAKVEPRLALEDLEMSRTVQRQPEIRFEVALKNNRTLLFSYKSNSAPRDNDNKIDSSNRRLSFTGLSYPT